MLMLILIKCRVQEGEGEEIFVAMSNCFEEHGLKHPSLTLIFIVFENTCCHRIQPLLSWFDKFNKPCTEPHCLVTGKRWKMDVQNTPNTEKSVHSASAGPRG